MITAGLLLAAATALPAPVRGDFDRDGRRDVARVVAAPGGYRLEVALAARLGRPIIIDTIRGSLANFYLHKAAAGRYVPSCAPDDCDGDAAQPMVVTRDAIAFGTEEASMAIAMWTGPGFRVAWIGD